MATRSPSRCASSACGRPIRRDVRPTVSLRRGVSAFLLARATGPEAATGLGVFGASTTNGSPGPREFQALPMRPPSNGSARRPPSKVRAASGASAPMAPASEYSRRSGIARRRSLSTPTVMSTGPPWQHGTARPTSCGRSIRVIPSGAESARSIESRARSQSSEVTPTGRPMIPWPRPARSVAWRSAAANPRRLRVPRAGSWHLQWTTEG